MSNHPEHLDIYDSVGPPATLLAASKDTENEDGGPQVSMMQDISTFGIAGRIWDRYRTPLSPLISSLEAASLLLMCVLYSVYSSYVLDVFLRRPTDQYTFYPPCPIPRKCFLAFQQQASTNTDNIPFSTSCHVRILEIGAGTGFVGIALAKRLSNQCTVILTDLEEVVPLMQKNVSDNIRPSNRSHQGIKDASSPFMKSASEPASPLPTSFSSVLASPSCAHVEVDALAWGNPYHSNKILAKGPIDYVVASDLVHFPEQYPSLIQTFREITSAPSRPGQGRAAGTKIIFGYKERSLWREAPFWEEFGRYFEIETVRIERKRTSTIGEKVEEGSHGRVQEEEDEGEELDDVQLFGCEEGMYIFLATKRQEEDILVGVDDTLATLMMMQIGI